MNDVYEILLCFAVANSITIDIIFFVFIRRILRIVRESIEDVKRSVQILKRRIYK